MQKQPASTRGVFVTASPIARQQAGRSGREDVCSRHRNGIHGTPNEIGRRSSGGKIGGLGHESGGSALDTMITIRQLIMQATRGEAEQVTSIQCGWRGLLFLELCSISHCTNR